MTTQPVEVNTSICEALGCYAIATERINVIAGPLKTTLLLCKNCVHKFRSWNIIYINNHSDRDKDLALAKNRCFRCNGRIYFTSKEAQTPSGRATKDPLTGKVIALDPLTNDHHVCKPEDISIYKETEEYKERIAGWKSRQQQKNFESISNTIKDSDSVSFSNHAAYKNDNNNNSTSLTLEKILTGIDNIKSELAAIKNSLKIGTDVLSSSSSDEKQVSG